MSLRLRALSGLACALVIVVGGGSAAASASATELFFSEYIEGTSNNKALEIYNGTGAPVSLTGYSVQMFFNGSSSAGLTINLSGTVAAGDVYVVAHSSAAPEILAHADLTNGAGWFNGDDAVVLRNGATHLDVIGQIGVDPGSEWGSGATSTADNTLRRKAGVAGGDADGSNAFDPAIEWEGFATNAFDGLGSHGAVVDEPPSVASTSPLPGATGVARESNVEITFSEPVDVAGEWFALQCSTTGTKTATVSGGPTSFTLDPATNFAANETCTVTIRAANVTDRDGTPHSMAADHSFSFTVANVFACGDPATKIHAVQGSGAATPLAGQLVTIEGVVVGDYQGAGQFNGYYVQEEDADADANPATSEGIFVFAGSSGLAVDRGDVVRVRGTASEFSGQTQVSATGSSAAVAVCADGASVTPAAVSLPVGNVADHERHEGMLVRFDQTLTATEVFSLGRFGEVSLSGVGRLYIPTAVAEPGAAAQAVAAQNARSRIILDDGSNTQNNDPTLYPQGGLSASNTLRVGDTLAGLTGVMDYRFSNYRIQPVDVPQWLQTNPRTPAPAAVGGNLKVASFNVLNFFNGDGTGGGFPTSRGAETQFELDRQTAKIVSALAAIDADVVGLMEIENDAGPNSAIAELVAELNAAMGAGTYAYVDTGVIGGDEIKVALIYKPAEVSPAGDWKILTSAVDPRFDETRNRPALAQTFRDLATGQELTVVVNHLKSKGSACGAGDDATDGSGNCNLTRTRAAAALADWLATDPTGSGDPDVLVIGDLNAYTFETPITTLEGAGYENLVRRFGGLEAYSYVFNGESGYLDHALASESLAAQVTGATEWHINPDEPIVLDYNVNFKSANHVNTLYAPGPYRASDHDPVIVGIHLNSPPTVSAGGPYAVDEGGSVSLSASGDDADGDALAYAWDLDGDGTYETAGRTATFSAAAIDGPATRTVGVRATDPSGDSAVATAVVEIANVAPTGTLEAPARADAGFPYALTIHDQLDPSAADAAALEYAFDCGDGYGAFGPSSSATCTTTVLGPRSVGAKIRDDDGGVTEYRATVEIVVSYASLCELTRQYAATTGIADSLCAKLDAAAAAEARGNAGAKQGSLGAYVNEVQAQSGKALTAVQAETLVRLARSL